MMGVLCVAASGAEQQPSASEAHTGVIAGTVMDPNGAVVPGATVAPQDPGVDDPRAVLMCHNGFFLISGVLPGSTYRVTVSAPRFAEWPSDPSRLRVAQLVQR